MSAPKPLDAPPLKAEVFGDGARTAVLLHGFPDDPGTFTPLIDPLVSSGWRLVVPWMRGYGPSGPAPDGRYDLLALASDVIALLDAAEASEGVVIGHDWGAITAYLAAILHPSRVKAIATLAVPPTHTLLAEAWRRPGQLIRSRYMAQLQSSRFRARELRPPDFPLIETLWRRWSPGWDFPPERLQAVRETFAHGDTAQAATGYYHHLLPRGPLGRAGWRETLAAAKQRIPCPGLLLTGADDGCMAPDLFKRGEDAFDAPCEVHVLPGVGHFLHQEDPDATLALLLPWLERTFPL